MACLSFCSFLRLSVYLGSVYLCLCFPTCLPVCWFVCLSVCVSVFLSGWNSDNLFSICLSVTLLSRKLSLLHPLIAVRERQMGQNCPNATCTGTLVHRKCTGKKEWFFSCRDSAFSLRWVLVQKDWHTLILPFFFSFQVTTDIQWPTFGSIKRMESILSPKVPMITSGLKQEEQLRIEIQITKLAAARKVTASKWRTQKTKQRNRR